MSRDISRLAGLDSRSMALLRVSFAAIVLVDLALRARSLAAHYTDGGVLPTWAAVKWLGGMARFVPHAYLGSVTYEGLLFALTAIGALALLLGYRTRLASIVVWFLVASMQARNPTINTGGDNLLRIMLFWCMLLPLGTKWSIDAAQRDAIAPRRVTSLPTFAIQMQLCLMYWFTVALKWDPAWIESFSAVEMALSVDYLATPLGHTLLAFPGLLAGLTAFTMVLEIAGPLIVWSPVWTGPLRFLIVLLFVMFHLVGLAPTLHLGLFPWVCAAAWLMFLPTWMWDRIESDRARGFARVERFFDRLSRGFAKPRLRPGERVARGGRALTSVVAVVMLASVLIWNLRVVERERHGASESRQTTLVSGFRALMRASRLNQTWAMFAPHPPLDDGWYVMPGKTASGREVDPWRQWLLGSDLVDWNKPLDVPETFGPKRWNKYLVNLSNQEYRYHRPLFSEWLCRTWNRTHMGEDRLIGFSMVFMLERFDAPEAAPEAQVLWVQECR